MSPRFRLRSLDGLRGLAAVIVLVHHALLVIPALAAPYYGQTVQPGLPWLLVHTPLHLLWAGTEAVYLFFILSGLVLTLAARSASFT
ncbi:acyltransferase family protein, partial [Blautia wexlerae]